MALALISEADPEVAFVAFEDDEFTGIDLVDFVVNGDFTNPSLLLQMSEDLDDDSADYGDNCWGFLEMHNIFPPEDEFVKVRQDCLYTKGYLAGSSGQYESNPESSAWEMSAYEQGYIDGAEIACVP